MCKIIKKIKKTSVALQTILFYTLCTIRQYLFKLVTAILFKSRFDINKISLLSFLLIFEVILFYSVLYLIFSIHINLNLCQKRAVDLFCLGLIILKYMNMYV